MARILFAAHDSGGANLLQPVAEACEAAGHEVRRIAHGPARALWGGRSRTVRAEMRAFGPDLAVTGTSKEAGFEQRLWRVARNHGVGTIAAIDAWMNLRDRFVRSQDGIQPDALLVIDQGMKQEIAGAGWCRARLYVGGQPYLERQAIRLRRRRAALRPKAFGRRADRRLNSPRVVVFFSEPLAGTAAAGRVGYDQFLVAGLIADRLPLLASACFIIQPHPKEKAGPWHDWLVDHSVPPSLEARVSDRTTEDLLVAADAVTSMASMVVIEAAVAGIPALAVQPRRNYCPNPAIDSMPEIRLVTDPVELVDALAEALATDPPMGATERFAGSTEACLRAIETELRTSV
ncbi:MAG: hypothetical protein ACE5JZ_00210 [Kiloniellales bacterium]